MLISLALALAAATLNPRISVSVHASRSTSTALVAETFREAAAIWSEVGVTLQWEIAERLPVGPALSVFFDEDSRAQAGRPLPMGWIIFDPDGVPEPEIHLSHANALALVQQMEGPGAVANMTIMELRMLLSRALGRALAHELGHYLLASKVHTSDGLMKATRPAHDFIVPRRDAFEIDRALRLAIDARLKLQQTIAHR